MSHATRAAACEDARTTHNDAQQHALDRREDAAERALADVELDLGDVHGRRVGLEQVARKVVGAGDIQNDALALRGRE